MNIAIITTSISLGGITSYLTHFANYLCEKGHDVTVFYTSINDDKLDSFDNRTKLVRYAAPNMKSVGSIFRCIFSGGLLSMIKIRFRNRNKISPAKDNQRLNYFCAKQTRSFSGSFDVAISSAEFYCNYLVELRINAAKKIAWIHPDLSLLDIDMELSRRVLCSFYKICLVSDSCFHSFVKIFPEFKSKASVIENIIDQDEITKKAEEVVDESFFPKSKIKIVTVCRFDNSSKRIDRIIRASRLLKEHQIEFIWNIVGAGPDADYIKELVDETDVGDVVKLLGSKSNPYPFISKSDVFVLSSQYEGKPIVVDEALGLHVPCIVTNYKSAKQQVLDEYGAVLDNDDESFSTSLLQVLTKENIAKWKGNLSSYVINNSYIEEKIDKLIGK